MRNGIRYSKSFVIGLMLVLGLLASGCQWFRRDQTTPTHQLRSGTSGLSPSGFDDRARQIESNLGVR